MIPVVFAYIGYALLAASVAYTFYMLSRGAAQPDDMKPSSMDDFNITTADEGSKVPLQYGIRKITGNLLYYGRLRTEKIEEEVGSGKNKQKVTIGYKYFLDVWLSLGHGPLTILDYYINEDKVDGDDTVLEYKTMTFSNGVVGNGVEVPDRCGEAGLTEPGVAWIYFERLLIGENTNSIPTIHFVTERIPTGIPLTNIEVGDGGVNPASICYDLLLRSGGGPGDINTASFLTASTYWYNKGYGMHVVFKQNIKCRDAIKKVLSTVGGSISQDSQGKFYLIAFDEADASVATLDFDLGEIRELNFQRPMWDVLYVDFVGSYLDRTQDFSKRTVKAYNPALHRILGRRPEQAVDLTCFADLSVASKRIWDIMKENTYPAAQISCEVPIKYCELLVGQVVTINYSRFGISNADFRVTSKDVKNLEDNFLKLELRQMTEKLYDQSWATAGGSSWTVPNYTPGSLVAAAVWQMPFNHFTGTGDYDRGFYAVLAARSKESDTGFLLSYSPGGGSYTYVSGGNFSLTGTLTVGYNIDSKDFDDVKEFTFWPPNNFGPEFENISLAQAAAGERLLLINNELMGFANITYNENGTITLTNIFRGMCGTNMGNHSVGQRCWIFKPTWSNMFFETNATSFSLRFQAFSLSGTIPVEEANVVSTTKSDLKTIPGPPVYSIYRPAVDEYVVTLYPNSAVLRGAGQAPEEDYNPMTWGTKIFPPGQIAWSPDAGSTKYFIDDLVLNLTAYSTNYRFYTYVNGKFSEHANSGTPGVGATFWSSNVRTFGSPTYLRKLPYGIEHPASFLDSTFQQVFDLLKISSLADVSLASLVDGNYLMYDSSVSKFKNVTYAAMNVTVTTTTTTTTTV
jgi:hypothetical protein